MKKHHVVIAAILLILAGLVILRQFSSGNSKRGKAPFSRGQGRSSGPVAVKTAPVLRTRIQENREFTGTVKAAYTYVVAAKISGRLLNLTKRIGDKVGREEIIGRIDDTEHRQALEEAEAQTRISRASISEASAQLEQAQRENVRVKDLVSKGISSQAELEAALTQLVSLQSRLELAKAQLAQRQAALDLARTHFQYTRIRSAQPGLVAVRHMDGGTLLSPNAAIYTIVGIDTVLVEVGVTERDYQQIKIGQKATLIVDAIAGREFTGVIARSAPLFQAASRTAVVEISIPNNSLLLKPGMFASIKITLSEKDTAIVIPSSAIKTTDQTTSVFLLDSASSTVKLVPVKTGIVNGEQTEILSPPIQGQVVTVGNHLLSDNAKVITEQRSVPEKKGRAEKGNHAPRGKTK